MEHLLMLVILKVKEIAEKLGLIADYVVEQGVIGSMVYRKWYSGIAECWGVTVINTAITQTSPSGVYSSDLQWVSLPSNLFTNIYHADANVVVQGGQWSQVDRVSKEQIAIKLFYTQIYSNAIDWRTTIEVKGTWK